MPVNREAITVDLDRIRGLNRAQLAYEAGCGEPSHESEGARLLSSVRDGLVELIESELDSDDYLERACDSGDAGELDYGGALHEIADGAPSVYTWTTWQEFTDLQAWQEDPTDLGFEGENMEKGANICLYMIADRLVRTLAESVVEAGATEPDEAIGPGPGEVAVLDDGDLTMELAFAEAFDDPSPDAVVWLAALRAEKARRDEVIG